MQLPSKTHHMSSAAHPNYRQWQRSCPTHKHAPGTADLEKEQRPANGRMSTLHLLLRHPTPTTTHAPDTYAPSSPDTHSSSSNPSSIVWCLSCWPPSTGAAAAAAAAAGAAPHPHPPTQPLAGHHSLQDSTLQPHSSRLQPHTLPLIFCRMRLPCGVPRRLGKKGLIAFTRSWCSCPLLIASALCTT